MLWSTLSSSAVCPYTLWMEVLDHLGTRTDVPLYTVHGHVRVLGAEGPHTYVGTCYVLPPTPYTYVSCISSPTAGCSGWMHLLWWLVMRGALV